MPGPHCHSVQVTPPIPKEVVDVLNGDRQGIFPRFESQIAICAPLRPGSPFPLPKGKHHICTHRVGAPLRPSPVGKSGTERAITQFSSHAARPSSVCNPYSTAPKLMTA
jgi:hypothetical protein